MAWRKHMDEGQNRTRIYKKAVNQCKNSDLVRALSTVSYSSLIVLARPNCKRIIRFQTETMILNVRYVRIGEKGSRTLVEPH
jgi:hypothetical protein